MESIEVVGDACLKFLLAVVLAGAVGLERERKGRPAGLRTHVLVCLGSTLMMVVADLLSQELVESGVQVWLDKGRIAAGVITGIGFLGAGTIIFVGGTGRGLTTAAMLWFAATLGIAIGAGYFFVATCATAFALFVTIALKNLTHLLPSEEQFSLSVRIAGGIEHVDEIEDAISKEGYRVVASRLRVVEDQGRADLSFRISSKHRANVERLTQILQERFPDLTRITLER
ncbi:MAG: MgtC/SapB family protein [Candidatus Hydrogenedentes bacterium]|nr:MgtC/SapB family protein [Candidatus Hydrogenedentota bacterium]